MSLNRDDSMISGEEFRIRRFALRLEQKIIEDHLGVKRAAIDKWQRGDVNVPRRVREMLEMCETDVQAMIDSFVDHRIEDLHVDEPEGWPWGEQTWFVVLGRARFQLAELGVKATIGGRVSDAIALGQQAVDHPGEQGDDEGADGADEGHGIGEEAASPDGAADGPGPGDEGDDERDGPPA